MVRVGEVFREVAEADLGEVAKAVVRHLTSVRVWAFHGDLGAGKTTLIKAIGKELGIADPMSSPSFAIVNEYQSEAYHRVYHFDCYRLRREEEGYDIGMEEYFDSGCPCFIEWPEKIPSLLPEERGEVTLAFENESTRTIAISVHAG